MKSHSFYEPTDDFIERHGLHIDEQETWVSLTDNADWERVSKHIDFNKETGWLHIYFSKGAVPNRAFGILFSGYLPDEEALCAVLGYVGWHTLPALALVATPSTTL